MAIVKIVVIQLLLCVLQMDLHFWKFTMSKVYLMVVRIPSKMSWRYAPIATEKNTMDR